MGKCSCVAPYRKNGNNTYGVNCGAGVTVVSYPRATLRQQQLEGRMVSPPDPLSGDGSGGFPGSGGQALQGGLVTRDKDRCMVCGRPYAEHTPEERASGCKR